MGKKNKGKAGTVIWKVRDIHIHLDEHMETTNHFGEDSCGCQCGDCEGLEIDMEELAGKIAEKSGVDAGISSVELFGAAFVGLFGSDFAG